MSPWEMPKITDLTQSSVLAQIVIHEWWIEFPNNYKLKTCLTADRLKGEAFLKSCQVCTIFTFFFNNAKKKRSQSKKQNWPKKAWRTINSDHFKIFQEKKQRFKRFVQKFKHWLHSPVCKL